MGPLHIPVTSGSATLSPKIRWQISYPRVPRLFRELSLEKKNEKALLETGTVAFRQRQMAPPPATAVGPHHPLSLPLSFLQESCLCLAVSSKTTFHGCWAEQARAKVCLLSRSPSGMAWPRWRARAGGKQECTRENTSRWQRFHQ